MVLDGQALVPLNCSNIRMNGLNYLEARYEMEPQPGCSRHGVCAVSPHSIVFVPTVEKLLVSSGVS